MKVFTAPFIQKQRTNTAVVIAAAGTINSDTLPIGAVKLATAGADDSIVTNLQAMPRGTVTASSLLLFLVKADGFVRLIDSELMAAYTASTTTVIPETVFPRYSELTPLRLEAGDQLWVASQVLPANGIVFKAEVGDY